jgi:uncharacterized protein (TIGR03435 family)
MEWTLEPNPVGLPDTNSPPEPGTTFLQALSEQLGLKLKADKAPLRVLVIDHVERPSEN